MTDVELAAGSPAAFEIVFVVTETGPVGVLT
jgi:hypothetical protein